MNKNTLEDLILPELLDADVKPSEKLKTLLLSKEPKKPKRKQRNKKRKLKKK